MVKCESMPGAHVEWPYKGWIIKVACGNGKYILVGKYKGRRRWNIWNCTVENTS